MAVGTTRKNHRQLQEEIHRLLGALAQAKAEIAQAHTRELALRAENDRLAAEFARRDAAPTVGADHYLLAKARTALWQIVNANGGNGLPEVPLAARQMVADLMPSLCGGKLPAEVQIADKVTLMSGPPVA